MISPIFIILTIIAATMVVTSIHPVHSIVWLVLSFIGSAIVFIQLQANFIALATLIIYVGAIAVLFVFVLMMLNLSNPEIDNNTITVLPVSLVSITTLVILITGLTSSENLLKPVDLISLKENTNLQVIGGELYTFYTEYFILASVILLAAMIGGIVLTLNYSATTKRQNPFAQIERDIYSLPENLDNTNN